MYLSGYGILGMRKPIKEVKQVTQLLTCQAKVVSAGVVAVATMRGTRVSPTAAGAVPPTASAARVFVLCEPSRRAVSSFRPYVLQLSVCSK